MELMMIKKNEFRCMGTDIRIEIQVDINELPVKIEKTLAEAESIFFQNENIFSRFNSKSELSLLNANLGKKTKVSDKMAKVLTLCLEYYKLSNGYFDPRVIVDLENIGYKNDFKQKRNARMFDIVDRGELKDLSSDLVLNLKDGSVSFYKRMDTTGLVKGYTVDEVSEKIVENGYRNFIVYAGGDMFVSTNGVDSTPLNIEGLGNQLFGIKNEGVATSGITRKKWEIEGSLYHHLINPKKPDYFSKELKTVTVLANKTVEADVFAKTLFLLGKEKGMSFANKLNIKALFLEDVDKYAITQGMEKKRWTS